MRVQTALVGASAITATIGFVIACIQEFDAGYASETSSGIASNDVRATGSASGDSSVAAVLIAVNGVAVAFALGAALVTPLVGCFTRRYDAEVLERDVEAAAEYGAARENEAAAAAAEGKSAPSQHAPPVAAPINTSAAMASAWFESNMSNVVEGGLAGAPDEVRTQTCAHDERRVCVRVSCGGLLTDACSAAHAHMGCVIRA